MRYHVTAHNAWHVLATDICLFLPERCRGSTHLLGCHSQVWWDLEDLSFQAVGNKQATLFRKSGHRCFLYVACACDTVVLQVSQKNALLLQWEHVDLISYTTLQKWGVLHQLTWGSLKVTPSWRILIYRHIVLCAFSAHEKIYDINHTQHPNHRLFNLTLLRWLSTYLPKSLNTFTLICITTN